MNQKYDNPLDKYKSKGGEQCMKGNIYPTKYGYQIRFGRDVCLHAKTIVQAERILTGLRYETVRRWEKSAIAKREKETA